LIPVTDSADSLESGPERAQTLGEEIASAVSHGVGFLAIIAATPFLIAEAARRGSIQTIIGAALFAGSAALLYLASTLYHAAPAHRKSFFRMLDHLAIYILIAGTYTPLALGPLKGSFGWTIFALVWLLAVAGVLFKLFARFRFPYVSTAMYIGMGWLAVFIIRPLAAHLPVGGLIWLVAGGLAYTGGVLFYHWERMRYSHLIWHLFVLAGTACHFVAILRYAT
jgi:hemolysin III